jgi:pyruvate dehydrogenase E2 component (dihydrolipoamide acetyltransferase)
MTDFKMPSLGADMDEGTVLEWKVAVGDPVRKGDVVVEVDTDKAAFEVEADRAGTVTEILVEPGTTVPVGTVLARLAGDEAVAGAQPPAEAAPDAGVAEAPRAPSPPAAAAAAPPPPAAPAAGRRPKASPAARKRAAELDIDLAAIARGTGVAGSIRLEDVETAARSAAAEQAAPAVAQAPREVRLRRVIAAVMSRSKREIPHYYLEHPIDLERALGWLEQQNAQRPIGRRILPNVLLLKAVALGLREVPELNGFWIDDALERQAAVNLGVAVSLRRGGVIAPAIHDAADKTLDAMMAELTDLVRRARAGGLRHSEMTGGTITVTSLGDRGTDAVYGVIFPPQVALVGFGAVATRPWVVAGEVVPRRLVTATLSGDHRASDGHRGGLLLRAIEHRLQEPETL